MAVVPLLVRGNLAVCYCDIGLIQLRVVIEKFKPVFFDGFYTEVIRTYYDIITKNLIRNVEVMLRIFCIEL